jgi:hypothetical protein
MARLHLGMSAVCVMMSVREPASANEINRWFNVLDATAEAKEFLNNIGGEAWGTILTLNNQSASQFAWLLFVL